MPVFERKPKRTFRHKRSMVSCRIGQKICSGPGSGIPSFAEQRGTQQHLDRWANASDLVQGSGRLEEVLSRFWCSRMATAGGQGPTITYCTRLRDDCAGGLRMPSLGL